MAADPDVAVRISGNVNSARPTQRRALRSHVAFRRDTAADEPLGNARIQTACDRVFDRPVRISKPAYLEYARASCRVRPDQAEVKTLEYFEIGFGLQHQLADERCRPIHSGPFTSHW